MLTDYHLHLREDDPGQSGALAFSAANASRYRQAAQERGIAELGVSEHIYRFKEALGVWRHPLWRAFATDDLGAYCAFVREETDLKLGIEADYVPGRERALERLLERYDFDYVVGSLHFLPKGEGADPEEPERFGALDLEEYPLWGAGEEVEEVWARYFKLLGAAARSGLFDVIAHPDLIKLRSPRPPDPLRRYHELCLEELVGTGVAVEVSTAGLRKGLGEPYPAPALLLLLAQAKVPLALSSDAHRPQEVGYRYQEAVAMLRAAGVEQLCRFTARQRELVPLAEG